MLAVAQYKLEKAGDGNEAIDTITSGKPLGQVDAIVDALREGLSGEHTQGADMGANEKK